MNRAEEARLTNRLSCAQEQKELQEKLSFYRQMAVILDGSYFDFVNQTGQRDLLYESLQRNHSPLPDLEYEPLFAVMHSKFTKDEKAICGLMRGITTKSMYRHNREMVNLIESNPRYREELPDFSHLQDHLNLWLSKYARDLEGKEDRDDICLIYVGVKENKPFPDRLASAVSERITEIKSQQKNCNEINH